MHNSQPVHSSTSTVCISFDAPTIASTGQAWMHFVQPMQTSSSITRDFARLLDAIGRIQRLGPRVRAAPPARRFRPRRPADID